MDPNAKAGTKINPQKKKLQNNKKLPCPVCGKLVHKINQHISTKHGAYGFKLTNKERPKNE